MGRLVYTSHYADVAASNFIKYVYTLIPMHSEYEYVRQIIHTEAQKYDAVWTGWYQNTMDDHFVILFDSEEGRTAFMLRFG